MSEHYVGLTVLLTVYLMFTRMVSRYSSALSSKNPLERPLSAPPLLGPALILLRLAALGLCVLFLIRAADLEFWAHAIVWLVGSYLLSWLIEMMAGRWLVTQGVHGGLGAVVWMLALAGFVAIPLCTFAILHWLPSYS